jgi:hypothetical protein
MSPIGHETDMSSLLRNVRSQGQSGKHVLALSFSGFDPERTSPQGRHSGGQFPEIIGAPSEWRD